MNKINFKKSFIVVAVIGLLIFFHYIKILSPIENIFVRVLNPISSFFYDIGTNIRVRYSEHATTQDLTDQVRDMQIQTNALIEENAELHKIQEENEILREHLGFLERNKYKYVMSNVISRGDVLNTSNESEIIVIDKGKKQGLYNGLAVVNSKGIIVGKIFDVEDNISKVYLTNNKNCKLAATVLGSSNTSGATEGELGLTVKMNFIPQDQKIKNDDIIITSGLEDAIPKNLVIGKVIEVKKESNELWQTAIIEPIINLNDLVIVSVLIP